MTYRHMWAVVIGIVSMAWQLHAQSLHVGDTLDVTQLSGVLHYGSKTVSLEEFRGKNLIIEFWSKSCVVCIRGFPKLARLQESYGSQLQIVAVSKASEGEVQKILDKQKVPQGIIPFVTQDSVLSERFPKNYVPWIVWIDTGRVVRYITDFEWLTPENVKAFSAGAAPPMKQNEHIKKGAKTLPLIAEGEGKWLNQIPYYSYLAHCIKGRTIRNADSYDSLGGRRITRNCLSAVGLLLEAFSEEHRDRFAYSNLVIVEGTNTYQLMEPKERDTAWKARYSYSYEISVPREKARTAYEMMQVDLQQLFGVEAKIRKAKVPCLLLIRTDTIDRIQTQGGSPGHNLYADSTTEIRYLKNMPFSLLVIRLQQLFNPYNVATPFIDATGYRGNVDIQIPDRLLQVGKLAELKSFLQIIGLDLITQPFETDVLHITEKERGH